MRRYLDLIDRAGETLRWAASYAGAFTAEGMAEIDKYETKEIENRVQELAKLMGAVEE